jgi:predicted Fe-Mo cluster-binding NifX family protein
MTSCRIAISADSDDGLDAQVAAHFGRCPYFTLVKVQDGEIVETRSVENPYYASHQPGEVPAFIASLNVGVMLSGGMGGRAAQVFDRSGIEAVTGAAGTARKAVEAYLSQSLSGAEPCEHH